MPRISVVPYENIIKIYGNTHHSNYLRALEHLENAYEHGMTEVIKEMAYVELLNYENEYEETSYNNT